jgi:hypothetical protein
MSGWAERSTRFAVPDPSYVKVLKEDRPPQLAKLKVVVMFLVGLRFNATATTLPVAVLEPNTESRSGSEPASEDAAMLVEPKLAPFPS